MVAILSESVERARRNPDSVDFVSTTKNGQILTVEVDCSTAPRSSRTCFATSRPGTRNAGNLRARRATNASWIATISCIEGQVVHPHERGSRERREGRCDRSKGRQPASLIQASIDPAGVSAASELSAFCVPCDPDRRYGENGVRMGWGAAGSSLRCDQRRSRARRGRPGARVAGSTPPTPYSKFRRHGTPRSRRIRNPLRGPSTGGGGPSGRKDRRRIPGSDIEPFHAGFSAGLAARGPATPDAGSWLRAARAAARDSAAADRKVVSPPAFSPGMLATKP